MPSLFTLIRVPLGFVFLLAGANHFMQWFPLPEMAEPARVFLEQLRSSGYFMDIVAASQILGGAFCFLGLFVPLGALILAPIVVQIFFFHLYLDPANLWIAVTLVALELIVFVRYWTRFLPFVSPW
jgi:uncharacterized membrane protein YphA (DoxX/SURF4 family)